MTIPPSPELLCVTGLAKAFGGLRAVAGVGFSVAAARLVALIGPNGAGKSTCFNLLGGQLRADSGSARLAGVEMLGRSPQRLCRLGLGRTFQCPTTFLSMTVLESVQLALLAARGALWRGWRPVAAYLPEEAMAVVARVGLGEHARRFCAELSYGDLKRVELALALAARPRLLLMDEPTAGLAPSERHDLMVLVRGLVRDQGLAVLFTEHDMDVVFGHADRVIVLDHGRVIADADPAEVRADPRVQAVYLGSGAGVGIVP